MPAGNYRSIVGNQSVRDSPTAALPHSPDRRFHLKCVGWSQEGRSLGGKGGARREDGVFMLYELMRMGVVDSEAVESPRQVARAVDGTSHTDCVSSSLGFATFLEECHAGLSNSLALIRSILGHPYPSRSKN